MVGAGAWSHRWAALLALATVGCGGATPPSAAPDAPGRRWLVATPVDLAGVNELVSGGVRFSQEILRLLFLGLLEEQPDYAAHPPSFRPALAESWELSPARDALTVRLRADARWSDGRPITARDVLFSHRAQTSPEVAWSYADSKDAISELTALDERTLVFRFREVYPYQVVDANDGLILPAHAWEEIPFSAWRGSGERFRERLVTSGPYSLAEWIPGVELTLAPNPHFPAPLGRADRAVTFRVVPDAAALVERLAAGAFDFADGLSPYDAVRVARSPRLRLLTTDARQIDFVGWNASREPFDDPEVRRALTLGIDRQALVDALWQGRARVAAGPVPANVWARDPELVPWPYDPAAARTLLAARGFADRDRDGIVERHGKPFRFELSTNSENRVRADACVLIQEQLRRIGVEVEIRTLEIHALVARNEAREFDATLAGWSIDTTLDFRPYFHSSARAEGWNWVGYAEPEVDRALEEARRQGDAEATRPHLVRLQRLLHRDQPYTFLWEPQRISAARVELAGVETTPLSAFGTLPHWRRTAPAR